MVYPFLTLNDNTEIVHSEMQDDGQVKVYIETPDEQYGFKHATCFLPQYQWKDILGYTNTEINYFQEILETTAHLILQFSQEGGFENASNF